MQKAEVKLSIINILFLSTLRIPFHKKVFRWIWARKLLTWRFNLIRIRILSVWNHLIHFFCQLALKFNNLFVKFWGVGFAANWIKIRLHLFLDLIIDFLATLFLKITLLNALTDSRIVRIGQIQMILPLIVFEKIDTTFACWNSSFRIIRFWKRFHEIIGKFLLWK